MEAANKAIYCGLGLLGHKLLYIVCCVGRVEIQIEIRKGWCNVLQIWIVKSNVSSVVPSSERKKVAVLVQLLGICYWVCEI